MALPIFEGEHSTPKGNHYLGRLRLGGIEIGTKGTAKVLITLKINSKGELSAEATDQKTKSSSKLEIERRGRFTDEQISKMQQELAAFPEEVMPTQNVHKNEEHSSNMFIPKKKMKFGENETEEKGYPKISRKKNPKVKFPECKIFRTFPQKLEKAKM